jgi:hypothetical protein
MGLLITKEWLLGHVRTQRTDVDRIISKLNSKITEAKRAGHTHYTWEAYEIKENPDNPDFPLVENINGITFQMVMNEIKEAGYDTKVFGAKESSGMVRVDINWDEKSIEQQKQEKIDNKNNKKQLEEYNQLLKQYQIKLDNYTFLKDWDKVEEYNNKIREISNLRAALILTAKGL